MSESEIKEKALAALIEWYDSRRPSAEREPERYVVCAGLAVLELMRDKFPLDRSDYITEKNQVKTSGPLIKSILGRYGEFRIYAKEGARTTRGTVPAAVAFVGKFNLIDEIRQLADPDRRKLIDDIQRWLADKAREYFNRKTIDLEIKLDKPGAQIIGDIIAKARDRQQMGPVAQHLVGAKLALRYPELNVENYSFTTADQQTGRSGDFLVGDTVFHVTVAPAQAVIDKCAENIRHGYRAILLVLESKLVLARSYAENAGLLEKIGIHAIEEFVGQNVEEISEFKKARLAEELRRLFELYNERVAQAETDLSLLIEIPENL